MCVENTLYIRTHSILEHNSILEHLIENIFYMRTHSGFVSGYHLLIWFVFLQERHEVHCERVRR
jgi:hypothetical protein